MVKIVWDHVVHYVNDLKAAEDRFADNGLIAFKGGSHTQWGTYNALSYFGLTYLEFLGVENRERAEKVTDPNDVVLDSVKHLPEEEVLSRLALRTDDIESVRYQLVNQGLEVSPVMEGKRYDAEGQLIEWKMMTIPGNFQGLPYPFVIQWKGTDEEREQQLIKTGTIKPHPVGEVSIERAIFQVQDPKTVAQHWANLFGFELKEIPDQVYLQVAEKAFIFKQGDENKLTEIEFRTDSEKLKGKKIVIGEGTYTFR